MDHFAYEATSSSLCPPYKPMSRPLGAYTSKHRRGILRQHFRCVSFFRGEVWTHLTRPIPHPAVWPRSADRRTERRTKDHAEHIRSLACVRSCRRLPCHGHRAQRCLGAASPFAGRIAPAHLCARDRRAFRPAILAAP